MVSQSYKGTKDSQQQQQKFSGDQLPLPIILFIPEKDVPSIKTECCIPSANSSHPHPWTMVANLLV